MTTYTAALRIIGIDLDPVHLSRLLGLRPDISHRRGDEHRGKGGRRFADFAEGLWSIESSLDPVLSPAAHIEHLLERLEGCEEEMRSLKNQGVKMDLFIGVFGWDGNVGFSLPSSLLKAIGDLGFALDFDLYAFSADE